MYVKGFGREIGYQYDYNSASWSHFDRRGNTATLDGNNTVTFVPSEQGTTVVLNGERSQYMQTPEEYAAANPQLGVAYFFAAGTAS